MLRSARRARLRGAWRRPAVLQQLRCAQLKLSAFGQSPCAQLRRASAFGQSGFEARESLYERLGVTPEASLSEIKQGFYRKAKDCHPDLHGQDAALVERFRDLADAYDVLSDAEARQKYDATGIDQRETVDQEKRWKPGDGWSMDEMEGNQNKARWGQVLRDREVLQQAREEYLQELRRDLKEACESALTGDFSGIFGFIQRHPGTTAAGLLLALPVLAAVRSPTLFLLTLQRLALVEALATKLIISVMLPWLAFANSSIPDRIWKARVASARRAVQRREAQKQEASGTESEGKPTENAKNSGEDPIIMSDPVLKEVLAVSAANRNGLSDATSLVPNVIYLDDSTSMVQYWTIPEASQAFSFGSKYRWEETCLQQGRKELIELASYLEGTPTRVVKFGGVSVVEECWDAKGRYYSWNRTLKMLRTLLLESSSFQNQSDLPALLKAWDGSSQGTYMWKMIETDVLGTYHPGPPIRVHLITDGLDTHSPGEFRGIQGMDVLKASLREKGYRIQWNIILLLFGAHGFSGLTARRYKELCESSGGVFQVISDGYSNSGSDEDLRLFLDSHDVEQARQQMRDLLLAARTGSGDEIHLPLLSPAIKKQSE
ncbi:unnamed protein product [Polarella glacialis]|uniref:J domain-containing protein n=1 Tax=Polarella glacialis TaxID=89957 RepID=A0A813M115_POLGL|nr:unnamed protein product [Polarella glacialis]